MSRVALTDENGWFETETSESFREDTWFNGSNNVSVNTDSEWTRERLWRTTSRRWILETSSQYENTRDTFAEISDDAAAHWLVKNNRVHDSVKHAIADLEL